MTTIDLKSANGNVFVIISMAANLANQKGLDGKAITKDMMSADYYHALDVFEKHFGDLYTFENDPRYEKE